MEIIALKPTGFSSNCFIIHSGKQAFVVDPSISEDKIIAALEQNALALKGILLTHGHFDHIWRAQQLRERTGAPLYVHKHDAEMLTDPHKNAFATFTGESFTVGEADILLNDNDVLTLGEEQIKVIHTPGHTRGSVCYETEDFLLSGDTLFAEGFGRYDLYGGDLIALRASLSQLCEMAKNNNKWIHCGHGESSTLKAATDKLKFYFDI